MAVHALYRAGSFIHELTHVKHATLPGFRTGWNALIGVPMDLGVTNRTGLGLGLAVALFL